MIAREKIPTAISINKMEEDGKKIFLEKIVGKKKRKKEEKEKEKE
jgi:hypothetical protein